MLDAARHQLRNEKASFHTPGHKGRLSLDIEPAFAGDLTELPGLDELSRANGVLQELQGRFAGLWNARTSLISVNGASAALSAAILACAGAGKSLLLPRNAHRSAINALILSGLAPIWYEPDWLTSWGTWGATNPISFKRLLAEHGDSLAAAVITSPNYAGVLSEIEELVSDCREHGVISIVDEAHGAHLGVTRKICGLPEGALSCNADLVAHSLHKTLTAPTQTGILHINKHCPIKDEVIRASLNALQSSSPSYLLMLGIENSLADLDANNLKRCLELSDRLKKNLNTIPGFEILEQPDDEYDPLHILIRHRDLPASELHDALADRGIYAETVLGAGVLILLGLKSTPADIDLLIAAASSIEADYRLSGRGTGQPHSDENIHKPPFCPQQLNPRQAFFAESILIPAAEAEGKIASDWIAPCPPGYPILVPGQKITREIIEFLETSTSIRVVKHPQLEGDSDGSNTACR